MLLGCATGYAPSELPECQLAGVCIFWSDDEISFDNSPHPLAGVGGDPACGMGEGFADLARRKQPLTPGFAVPSPLGEGRYQLRRCCESKCRNSSQRRNQG